ncbi:MAG TPA: UDP-N-acetylmuramoyl-tripeptide--D-alanyl-D-alanine ligase [Planctomycetota bacterium]|nr:UDP-N-acetylmuramoyl-tripeptide--D-alanyl-D-alanine ligase [Planctomycetota bacterium]
MSAAAHVPTEPPAPFVLSRAEAESLTDGAWHGDHDAVEIRGAAIDSRAVRPGMLFACLPGARVDGHDFAPVAAAAGAALFLASRPLAVRATVLVVADVTAALGAIAAAVRRRVQGTRWIGITGSSGKTTVKELIAAACAAAGPTWATRGNLNNQLGVPLTILNAPAGLAYAVIEMGANHQGEVAYLARIAQPEVGVITNIGPAHLEGFGGLAGVARGKTELFAGLPAGGTCLIGLHGTADQARALGVDPADVDAIVRAAAGDRRLLRVGSAETPIDGASEGDGLVLRTPAGEARLPLLGAHNLANAALAWHAAVAAGVDGRTALAGLARTVPVAGRLQPKRAGSHLVLDDTYNANPSSMIAGLRVLAAYPGRRLAVLGAMGELGGDTLAGHHAVGAEAARLGLALVTVGDAARAIGDAYRAQNGPDVEHHDERSAAIGAVLARLTDGPTTVLVKASRTAGLEVVADGVVAAAGGVKRT